MPSYMFDRVCETSTTTGTGDFTLTGAIAGYRTFTSVLGSFALFNYLIESVDGNGVANGQWEIGTGLLTSSTTMQRVLVLDSSTGSGISFSAGTKRVHLTAPAYQLQVLGFRAIRTTNLSSQNFTTATAIGWDSSAYDTTTPNGGPGITPFHSNVSNNSRITIPTGFERATCRFHGQVALQNITASEWVELKFRVDGGSTIIGRRTAASPSTTPTYQLESPLIELSDTQYVEMMIQVQTDTTVDLLAVNSYFEIEVLQ